MKFVLWVLALLFLGIGIFRLIRPEEFADDAGSYHRDIVDVKPFKDKIQFERFGGIMCIALSILFILISFVY